MTGFELILSTVLCLTCGNDSTDSTIFTSPNYIVRMPTPLQAQLTKQENLKNLQSSINSKVLKIATLEDYPLSYTELLPNGTRLGKGIAFQIIDYLKKKLNFTYEVIVPKNNIIGSSVDYQGSLIEVLNTSQADIAAAFIPLFEDARNLVRYSSTTLDEGEWIIVQRRPKDSATGSGLLKPFDTGVWFLILFSAILVSPVIYSLIVLRYKIVPDDSQGVYSLGHITWFVYGALVKQGSVLSPVADSPRLLFATWWLFITILTSFYTANLTAFLTLSKFTLPYNRMEDVLNRQKNFVAIRGGAIEYAIKNNNESLWMFNKMLRKNRAQFTTFVDDNVTLMTFVKKKNYVFVRDRPAVNHLIYEDFRIRKKIREVDQRKFCPFATSNQAFLKKLRTFIYPRDSNLSHIIDPELMKLVEGGVIQHLKRQNLPKPEICPQDLGGIERKLSNGDLMLTYYVMMGGYATSIVVFFIELILFCFNRHCRSKTISKKQQTVENGMTSSHDKLTSRRSRTKYPQTVTPPPPYASIFNRSISNNSSNKISSNVSWKSRMLRHQFGEYGVHQTINGRDYVVFKDSDGLRKLVPVRAPSASLFQYMFSD